MSETPKGYRMSEVGVIPEEWDVKNILDNSTLKARIGWQGLTTAEYLEQGIYYLVTGTDFLDRKINWNKCNFVDESRYVQDKNIQLKIEDVLVTKDGTIGKIAYIDFLPGKATLNSGIFVIRPKNHEYLPLYFFYVLKSIYFNSFLKQLKAGSTISHLYQKDFINFRFLVPPLPEQQAIASALSDVDALITALGQLIAKKRNIKQGAMQQLLTGKKRLPGFGGEWLANSIDSITPLNNKYGIVDGPFGSNLKTIHYRKSGIPIITSGYVTEGIFNATDYLYVDIEKFEQEKRSAVYGGDIVMAKIGARCGASAILPKSHEKGILSGNVLKITVDETRHSTYFIWQILWSIYTSGKIEMMKSVGAQPAISMPNLKKCQILLPLLPEQIAIAQILSDMDAEIEALEQKQAKYKAIKQGMMQELLTGKTRLV